MRLKFLDVGCLLVLGVVVVPMLLLSSLVLTVAVAIAIGWGPHCLERMITPTKTPVT